jgi:hypothetical protein
MEHVLGRLGVPEPHATAKQHTLPRLYKLVEERLATFPAGDLPTVLGMLPDWDLLPLLDHLTSSTAAVPAHIREGALSVLHSIDLDAPHSLTGTQTAAAAKVPVTTPNNPSLINTRDIFYP